MLSILCVCENPNIYIDYWLNQQDHKRNNKVASTDAEWLIKFRPQYRSEKEPWQNALCGNYFFICVERCRLISTYTIEFCYFEWENSSNSTI